MRVESRIGIDLGGTKIEGARLDGEATDRSAELELARTLVERESSAN